MKSLLKTKITKPLRSMGLGYIFILINFHIVIDTYRFDMLPDFIGYVVIYRAAVVLKTSADDFKQVSWIALLLSLISLPKAFMQGTNTAESFQSSSIGAHLYDQGLHLLMIVLIYFMYRALCDLPLWYYIRSGLLKLSLRKRSLWLIGVLMLEMLLYPFFLNSTQDTIVFVMFPLLISAVFFIMYIRVLYRMAKVAELVRG